MDGCKNSNWCCLMPGLVAGRGPRGARSCCLMPGLVAGARGPRGAA